MRGVVSYEESRDTFDAVVTDVDLLAKMADSESIRVATVSLSKIGALDRDNLSAWVHAHLRQGRRRRDGCVFSCALGHCDGDAACTMRAIASMETGARSHASRHGRPLATRSALTSASASYNRNAVIPDVPHLGCSQRGSHTASLNPPTNDLDFRHAT